MCEFKKVREELNFNNYKLLESQKKRSRENNSK